MIDSDPIALAKAAQEAAKDAEAAERRFQHLCRELFSTGRGNEWLRLAMARGNYMGSVFSAEDGMNPVSAAYRDGVRSVFSDILNSAVQAPGVPRDPENPDDSDDE